MFKAEEFDPENGGMILFRGVGTQKIIEFVSVRKPCFVRENVRKCCW
jgi:hypothetical protein